MSYTKSTSNQRIPAIQSTLSTLEDSFSGKCSAFRTTLFPPPPVTDPISWESYKEGPWIWQQGAGQA
ncbi:hypothetical protein EJ02DRAFT_418955 [Clathrospora elynae]|uniref:Uncharacterized protein n=1 Tax=Clathrospora elynae TaxID=706981 RepID=A0A6A5T2P9_9PLEO|nr:hypothetical protein EJ02DRAFT_418955 [Clathrospora elynae]